MIEIFRKYLDLDWVLFLSTLPLLAFGLITMSSFTADQYHFDRQLIWIAVSISAFLVCSSVDWRFLRRSGVITALYLIFITILSSLFLLGTVAKGAKSWFTIGGAAVEPADFMRIAMIAMLAKYFSRRHVEIANIRHIIVSGLYAFIPFILILLQPDFGSAIIIFFIWLGMIMVSGVSKKHLFVVATIGTLAFSLAWLFVFQPYQKDRIKTFVHPLADVRGAGYNAFQSTIAVGSGQ
ncbi:MAG: FtsW/RodA/SpoVE family cell cycle protein, partial [Patescibacteria group bacterium]